MLLLKWEFETATTEYTANGNKSKWTLESHKWCCRIVCIWILALLHIFFFAAFTMFDRKQTIFHETSKSIDLFTHGSILLPFFIFEQRVCISCQYLNSCISHKSHSCSHVEWRLVVLATHYLAFTKRNKIKISLWKSNWSMFYYLW